MMIRPAKWEGTSWENAALLCADALGVPVVTLWAGRRRCRQVMWHCSPL